MIKKMELGINQATHVKHKIKAAYKCRENINLLFSGQVKILEMCLIEETSTLRVSLKIQPNNGLYKNSTILFQIEWNLIASHHSNSIAPDVHCVTKLYHPNIDFTETRHNVCLDLLDRWQQNNDLDDLIQGLLYLLHQPNLADPLSPLFDPDMDYDEFRDNVKKSLNGQIVEGFYF